MSKDIFIPYAVFSESFQQAPDGSVTIARIINRLECVEKCAPVSTGTSNLPVLKVPYVVCFNSAEPVAGLKAELRCTRPLGEQFVVGTKTLDLAGEYKGTFLSGELDLIPREDGWHIFDVLVNGLVKTRMALHVSVKRQTNEKHTRILMDPKSVNSPIHKSFSQRKCYARVLGNCSQALSREHYISENILDEINRNGGLRVSGLPWQNPGEIAAIPPAALAAKVLCKRHNELLSTLDQLGGRFFRALNDTHAAWTTGQSGSDGEAQEFDGNGVERFLLKMLLGGVASGNLRGPKGRVVTGSPDTAVLKRLFGEENSPPSTGLFLSGELNVPWSVEHNFRAAAAIVDGNPVAILVSVALLRFAVTVTPEGKNSPLLAGKSFFRPASITILGPRSSKIRFTWTGDSGNQDVVVGPAGPLLPV